MKNVSVTLPDPNSALTLTQRLMGTLRDPYLTQSLQEAILMMSGLIAS